VANWGHCRRAMACDPSLLLVEVFPVEHLEHRMEASEHLVAYANPMADHKLGIGYHDSILADLLADLEVFDEYC
jgi:hypothetical protein